MNEFEFPHALDTIIAYGHPLVQATHPTTLEITTEEFLTVKGNCIIAIRANKSVSQLSRELKEIIKKGKWINVIMSGGDFSESLIGKGNLNLTLSDRVSMVFRKSNFISDRTGLVSCSKSSAELNRNFVNYLIDPSHKITIKFFEHIGELKNGSIQ